MAKFVIFLLIGVNLGIICSAMKKNVLFKNSKNYPGNSSASSSRTSSSSSSPFISEKSMNSFLKKRLQFYDFIGPKPTEYNTDKKCTITVNESVTQAKESLKLISKLNQVNEPEYFRKNFFWFQKSQPYFKGSLKIEAAHVSKKDYGGLTREWFTLVSKGWTDSDLGLFQLGDDGRLEIKPYQNKDDKKLELYEAAGIFTGMALLHRCLLHVSFSQPFLKSILNHQIDLEDVKNVDPKFFKYLKDIETNEEISGFNLKFYDPNNKKSKKVTNSNKHQHVKNIVAGRYVHAIEGPLSKFLAGLDSVIPLKLIRKFNEDELDLLISGVEKVDVKDWKENTVLKYYMNHDQDPLPWFWQLLGKTFSNEERRKLLNFVTGSTRVPATGFKEFNDDGRPFTIEFTLDNRGIELTADREIMYFDNNESSGGKLMSSLNNIENLIMVKACMVNDINDILDDNQKKIIKTRKIHNLITIQQEYAENLLNLMADDINTVETVLSQEENNIQNAMNVSKFSFLDTSSPERAEATIMDLSEKVSGIVELFGGLDIDGFENDLHKQSVDKDVLDEINRKITYVNDIMKIMQTQVVESCKNES